MSKAVLLYGMNPTSANEWLAHAEAMGWVMVDGDRVLRGSVNPAPMEDLPNDSLQHRMRWGPSWIR